MSDKEKTKQQLIEELQRLRRQVAKLQEPEKDRKRAEAERERLLTALERRSAQLQTAVEVSSAVSSILDPDELIQQVVNLARERFDLYYAGLFLVDQTGDWTGEPGKWAMLRAGTGEAGQKMLEQGHKLEIGGTSMIGWCVANKQARIALDVGEEAVRFDNPLLPETRSEMALPLISRGQVIGAMTIQSTQEAAFSEEDIAVLQTMADQLANAIENARLFEETLARTREVTALAGMGRKLASTLDLDAVLDSIIDACLELFQVQQSCFIMMDKDGYLRMRRHRGLSEEFVRSIVGQPGEGFYGKVYQSGEAILIRDAREQLDPDTAEAVLREGVTSFVHVPVKVKGETVAVMNLTSLHEDRRFSARDLERLSAFADQAAIAIENVRLFEDTESRLAQLTALQETTRAVASTLELDKLLSLITQQAATLIQGDGGIINLVDWEEKEDEVVAAIGSQAHTLGFRSPLEGSLSGWVALHNQPTISNQLQNDNRVDRRWRSGEVQGQNAAIAPLTIKDQVMGTLVVMDKQGGKGEFDQADLDLLIAFANQAATAIENARLFEETRRRAEEQQRLTRIAALAASTLELDELLERVMEETARMLNSQTGVLLLLDEERGELVTRYILSSHATEELKKAWRIPLDTPGFEKSIFARSGSYFCNDVEGDLAIIPAYRPHIRALKVHNFAGVALRSKGRSIGELYVAERPGDFGPEDTRLLRTIAGYVTSAIENARLFEEAQQEITERKRAEEALAQEQHLQHALMDNVPDAIYFKDTESRFIRINKVHAERWFGLSDPAEAIGKTDFDFFSEEHAQQAYMDEQEIIRTGQPLIDIEEKETWPDRPDTWVTTTKMPLRDAEGRIIGTFGITSDITERKQAEAERERLLAALERRSTQLQTAAEVSRAASSILDLGELIQQVVDLVRERFDLYYAGLFLVDQTGEWTGEPGKWAVLRAGTGEAGRKMLEAGHKLEIGDTSMIGWCVANKQARIALDVTSASSVEPGEEAVRFDHPLLPETRSELALPLFSRGQVIGAMTIQSTQEAAFSGEDIAVLQAMADQLANAIENARLFERMQHTSFLLGERVRELHCLNDIGRKIEETPPIPEFLPWVAARIRAAMQYPDLCLAAIQFEGQVYGATEAVSLPCQMVQALRISGEVAGRVYISYIEERDFTDEESAMLGDIVRRVSDYIESRHLFEETQARAEEIAVLNELGQALTARLNVEQVLEEAYRQASRLVDTTNFYIGLYDPERHEITFPFEVSESEIDRQITVMSADEGLTGYIVRNRTSLLFEENVAEQEKELGIESPGEKAQSWLGVPLMIGDQVLGVMAVQSHTTPRLYDEHDQALLTAIASQTAIALQNAYLFQETQARAEREHVIREISDQMQRATNMETLMRITAEELNRTLGGSRAYVRLGVEAQRSLTGDGADG